MRTVVADANGAYVIRALPPGTYKITFEMSGSHAAVRDRRRRARRGRPWSMRTLAVAGVQENVDVTAEVNDRRA